MVKTFASQRENPHQGLGSTGLIGVFPAVVAAFLWLALLIPAISEASSSQYPSSADIAGPVLPDDPDNEAVILYNQAIQFYQDGQYVEALDTMRAAVRARRLSDESTGHAYSNLCLMYLRVGKFRNAQASCERALLLLPNYVPALLNLARAENRERPE